MNYYYLYTEDGSREIICARCFLTIGVAHGSASAREIEQTHSCSNRGTPFLVSSRGQRVAPVPLTIEDAVPSRVGKLNLFAALVAASIATYALPTMGEFYAAHYVSPWISTILPGDLAGCLFLAVVFRMYRVGLLLYVTLTALEICLYETLPTSSQLLPWLTDLIPTLVVIFCVVRMKRQNRRPSLILS